MQLDSRGICCFIYLQNDNDLNHADKIQRKYPLQVFFEMNWQSWMAPAITIIIATNTKRPLYFSTELTSKYKPTINKNNKAIPR